MIATVNQLMERDFTQDDIEKRDEKMRELYHNDANAQLLIDCIFGK